jgi:hypothetical protein
MSRLDEVLLTTEMPRSQFVIPTGSTYLFSDSTEDRSGLDNEWRRRQEAAGASFLEVVSLPGGVIGLLDQGIVGGLETYDLTGVTALSSLLAGRSEPIYLDITGMTHDVWAPLVRAGLMSGRDFRAIYVEPAQYKRSVGPSPGLAYDLSEGLAGFSPLPGFARIRRARRGRGNHLVVLLGFEGFRFDFVVDTAQPGTGDVTPVVGVPGFRPEYPYSALRGNRSQLATPDTSSQMRYAKANCPFDAFLTLREIQSDHPAAMLRVAPIGTKPHGLGAVLFAIAAGGSVEILYDHPIRKAKRTHGSARVCVYEISAFAQSAAFTGVANGGQ